MSVTLGTVGPVTLASAKTYDPRYGWQITQRFKGSPSVIAALEVTHRTAGARTTIIPDDEGIWDVLECTYGAEDTQSSTEELTCVWTLQGNDIDKSVWEHPKVVAQMLKVPDVIDFGGTVTINGKQVLAAFKKGMEAYAAGESEMPNPGEPGTNQTVDETTLETTCSYLLMDWPVMKELLRVLCWGVETFTVSQYVLRRVLTVADNYSLKPSNVNVGAVYDTATLAGVENVPATIKFTMPDGYWLKRTPTVDQIAYSKWTLTHEWWHADQWDSFLYPVAI